MDKTRRLTKDPPIASQALGKLRTRGSSGQLSRTTSNKQRERSDSANSGGSQSSHSPVLTSSLTSASDFETLYAYSSHGNSEESFDQQPSSADYTKASGYHQALRRPGPSHQPYTAPDPRMLTPSLRQSASFSMGDKSVMPLNVSPIEGGFNSKRMSEESSSSGTNMARKWRKKSAISSIWSNVIGSPRAMKISAPENPVHMIHVGYDNETGQFTVCRDVGTYRC
jgi:P21-Rho-binding domain